MDSVIRKVTDYMKDNMSNIISLDELANMSYMNTAYFSRYFKKKTGQTVTDYLTGLRLEMAEKLLKDEKYKVYEVADKVGYDDYRYFCRLFKKKKGVSPLEFRGKK